MYCLKEKKGHTILESHMEGRTRHYHLICQKCGYESWRSDGFLKGSAKCPNCSGGRHNNNARGYGDDPLWKRSRKEGRTWKNCKSSTYHRGA